MEQRNCVKGNARVENRKANANSTVDNAVPVFSNTTQNNTLGTDLNENVHHLFLSISYHMNSDVIMCVCIIEICSHQVDVCSCTETSWSRPSPCIDTQ